MTEPELPEIPTISPTVGRRWLAQEVRRLREAAGLKQGDVAKRLRCGTAKIAHMESMRNTISGPDLETILPFLGVPTERIAWYLQLADLAKERGWWDGNRAIPDWFSLYIGLEWGASEIRGWDIGFPPGILQTRSYAEALIRSDSELPEKSVQEQADARINRQESFKRAERPLKVHVIIDESTLHRPVGTQEVMRGQIEYLVELHDAPNVTLQIMPFSAGQHRGQLGSFQWLGFPRRNDHGVVYLENQRGGLYLEESEEIDTFKDLFEELLSTALSPANSTKLLSTLAKENKS